MTRQLSLILLVSLAAAGGCTRGRVASDAGTEVDAGTDIGFAFPDLGFDAGPPPCMRGTIDCDGECVRVAGDDRHCGSCGNACAPGVHCAAGYCTCDDPLVSCSGVCLDPSDDPMNCGECGYVCGPGEMCTGGECLVMCDAPNVICRNPPPATVDGGMGVPDSGVDPDAGMSAPDGGVADAGVRLVPVCADLQTDAQNCGSCNSRCLRGATCTAGRCACPVGFLNCGGACVDPMTDPANCGSCRISCGSDGICEGSRCTTCGTGLIACTGRCLDASSDRYNCGSCGRACGAGEGCAGGLCSCVAPLIDCGAGCTNLDTDRVNCGTCGTDCGAGGVCTGGACTCATGLTMCGASCRDLGTDLNNCGTCGMVCPALVGGICAAGTCGCPAGLVDCGGTCSDPTGDRNNCGACGNVCPGTEVCYMSGCTALPPSRYMQTVPTVPVPFIDACGAAGHTEHLPTRDDGSELVAMPFAFRYWATDRPAGAMVNITTNGWLGMDGVTNASLSGTVPNTFTPNAVIAPHWGDNYTRGAICVATVGTAPNRQWVVEWNDSYYCCGDTGIVHNTYEVILSEGSNIIDFAYQTMTSARAQTMGIEDQTGAMGINACPGGTGTCIPTPGQRVRFVPIP